MIFKSFIEKMYRAQLFGRCDDTGNVYYFSAKDFKGLHSEPYSFKSKLGHTLRGNFYYYDSPIEDRLIVFDHGYGGGHLSYMKEIEMLCRRGYLVFSYDHTGCMDSEGDSTRGFAQSLCDLDDCITSLKASDKCKNMSISVVGHSWGGFSTLNIPKFHPDITHTVVLSGFISVREMVNQNFSGILKGYRNHIYGIEEKTNPDFVTADARETLADTKTKVLLIYSADDSLVKKDVHYDGLKNALSDKENVTFHLVEGKGHNPNFTADAVRYKDAFFADLTKKTKKKQLNTAEEKQAFINSYDWDRMTAQDEDIWQLIYKHLDN